MTRITADNAKCMHLIAGDGFAVMSDGREIYTFGFGDQTGTRPPTSSRPAS